MRKRRLKVEEHPSNDSHSGRYTKTPPVPKVRLKGRWLEAAGLTPGSYVTVTVISTGVIELRVCQPVQLPADTLAVMRKLDRAIANHDTKT